MDLIGVIIILFLLASLIFLMMLFFSNIRSAFTSEAPFVSLPKATISRVIDALEITDDSVVYDLGCGDGRILLACYKAHPAARYKGIEHNIVPFLLALWNTKASAVEILRKDFFHCNLSDATHIITFLWQEQMDVLLPKLEKELRRGTKLVSCDFYFSHKEPIKTIYLPRPRHQLGKTLSVYEF